MRHGEADNSMSLRVAVAGLGGFAGQHHRALATLESAGECEVVATCDPRFEQMRTEIELYDLRERGVAIYPTLEDLLSNEAPLDLVTLPTPIPLHARQHAQVVASGAACYLEKPPTLWWPEYEAMQEVERAAAFSTHVGFNFIGDPFRRSLKRRILAGEFGAMRGVGFHAVWPRNLAYYNRSDWAGKIRLGDRWVFDSPVGNALAHYTQNVLFWCGTGGVDAVGSVQEVSASLSHSHPIESFDTATIRATTEEGPWIRIAMTHLGNEPSFEKETLFFDRATIRFASWRSATIHVDGKEPERIESDYRDQQILLQDNLARYFRYVEGVENRPITRLADSRSFVALNTLAFLSSGGISSTPAPPHDESGQAHIKGLKERLRSFAEDGVWSGKEPSPRSIGSLDMAEQEIFRIFGGPQRAAQNA